MPLYAYKCEVCGTERELIQSIGEEKPRCCEQEMGKQMTFPAMVKIKGMGGYPSRRALVNKDTAPYQHG